MKNKKVIIIVAAILLAALCGFLIFGNKSEKPAQEGGLQLGIPEEDKEESKEKEDSEKKEENSKDESKKDDTSEPAQEDIQTIEGPNSETTEIPEGGQAVDNGDGSVTIIINDDEDTIGF